jgi:branched-chain amino acid transport system permease protein
MVTLAGGGLVWSLTAAMTVCGVLGLLMELGVYRPLRNRPRLAALIAAIGLSILLSNLVQAIDFAYWAWPPEIVTSSFKARMATFSGSKFTPFPADQVVANSSYQILPGHNVFLTRIQLLNFGVSLSLMAALWLIVRRTNLGRAMRACANNKDSLALMGISVNRVIGLTLCIGAALAGAAGVLQALTYPRLDGTMGLMAGLRAFIAAVLGGIGSVPGAVMGGFLMGLAEVAATASLPSSPVDYTPLADGVSFAILILVLLFRPQGIFGEEVSEKV